MVIKSLPRHLLLIGIRMKIFWGWISKDWLQGKQWVLFLRDTKHWRPRENKTVSRETSYQEICYNSQFKTRANCEKNKYLLDAGWHTLNLPADLGCTTWQVPSSPPIGKRIWVRRYNKTGNERWLWKSRANVFHPTCLFEGSKKASWTQTEQHKPLGKILTI